MAAEIRTLRAEAATLASCNRARAAAEDECERLRADLAAAREHAEAALHAHMVEAAAWRDATDSLTPGEAKIAAARLDAANARSVAAEAIALLDARLNPRTLEGYVFKDEAEAQLADLRARLEGRVVEHLRTALKETP